MNMNFNFDLKSFRETKLEMTQNELASLLNIRQDKISRLEKNPEQISLDLLAKLADIAGVTLDQIVAYKKPIPKALEVKNTWEEAKCIKSILLDYINNSTNSFINDIDYPNISTIHKLKNNIENIIRKPKVVFVGRSDSGKSTMINALIGKGKMPTNWTPTTSITVYIKHIDDRPSYIEEELWIFRKGDDDNEWDDSRLEDEEYCRKWKLAGGSAEMLSLYGTHNKNGIDYRAEIGSAVLFIDSDILKNCDLLDIPGFTGGKDNDNAIARKAKVKADILVYLSPVNGFLGSEDFSYLKDALNVLSVIENTDYPQLSLLSNLFIVASQSQIITNSGGNIKNLDEILDDGCDRFYNCITEKFWKDRSTISGYNYTQKDLRSRFFTYTTDYENIRKNFENSLRNILEQLPLVIKQKSVNMIKDYCNNCIIDIDNSINTYSDMISQREKYIKLLEDIEANEPSRKDNVFTQKHTILSSIRKYESESREKFEKKYKSILAQDNIVNIINEKKYKSKKSDMQSLCSYLNSLIEDSLKEVLEDESKEFANNVNNYISSFEAGCKINKISIPGISISDFNAKRAFASGLTGLATFGGLAFWASSLGNLGAYILVAKGVSILSALGISIAGGTATATAAVASIGGPVVLGIAIAVIAALGAFALFSGGWKKKVAKKIYEAFDDEDALLKYFNCINKFWYDTEVAFNAASDNMENEWISYINDLKDKIHNFDIAKLEDYIEKAKVIKNLFNNIPL